jgi:glutathione S-transferase
MQNIELVSFKICPFVQRSVIALEEKGIDYKITYIDLQSPPDWFKQLSPLGKVPLLKVNDIALFESAVISEFLDESFSPSLHPENLLEKAHQRAWIEFGSELLGSQFKMLLSESQEGHLQAKQALSEGLEKLEAAMDPQGPFFSGQTFRLIDTAYAPMLLRLSIVAKKTGIDLIAKSARLSQWADVLLAKESVKHSVVNDFESLFIEFFASKNSFAFK